MLLENMIEPSTKCEGITFVPYASIYVTKHDWETFAFPKPSHKLSLFVNQASKFSIKQKTASMFSLSLDSRDLVLP